MPSWPQSLNDCVLSPSVQIGCAHVAHIVGFIHRRYMGYLRAILIQMRNDIGQVLREIRDRCIQQRPSAALVVTRERRGS